MAIKKKTKEIVKVSPEFEKVLGAVISTKDQRSGFADNVIERITEGELNPLDVHIQLKIMEDLLKQVGDNPEYKRLLLEETNRARGESKDYSYYNANFTVGETGVKHDYSKCNDPEMTLLLSDEKELKDKIKKRGEFLKNVPIKGMEILVDDELIKIYPPSKTSTTSVITKLS